MFPKAWKSFIAFVPGVNFVVEDDEDDKGADDVEEQVHPEDIDLEQITIGSNDTITKSTF